MITIIKYRTSSLIMKCCTLASKDDFAMNKKYQILIVLSFSKFGLDERHNCTFGKKSGVYGGEKIYRYICDTSAEECQESCHKDHYCAAVSHTVHGDMNHCKLYTKDDALAIEDSGSTLWMKYCMNGWYF